jgi:hypothetical protein
LESLFDHQRSAPNVPNARNPFQPGTPDHQHFASGFDAARTGNAAELGRELMGRYAAARHAPNVPNARNPFQPGTPAQQHFARGFDAARTGNAAELGRELMGRYAPERFFGDANRRNQG